MTEFMLKFVVMEIQRMKWSIHIAQTNGITHEPQEGLEIKEGTQYTLLIGKLILRTSKKIHTTETATSLYQSLRWSPVMIAYYSYCLCYVLLVVFSLTLI